MLKKIIVSLFILTMILSTVGCGETKTLHCDGCGVEVEVDASSNMDEDWTIFCSDCEKKNGLDTIVE